MHACCTFTSQCQQQGTPFTIFFLSPGLQGKLQMDSGTDLSPPDHCISSSYRHPGRKRGIQPHKERQNTKTQQEYFHVHSSYIESQIVGPLADDMVARVAVIGHLKLEDVVASRSVSVLVEQNACTSTSCETDRPRHL